MWGKEPLTITLVARALHWRLPAQIHFHFTYGPQRWSIILFTYDLSIQYRYPEDLDLAEGCLRSWVPWITFFDDLDIATEDSGHDACRVHSDVVWTISFAIDEIFAHPQPCSRLVQPFNGLKQRCQIVLPQKNSPNFLDSFVVIDFLLLSHICGQSCDSICLIIPTKSLRVEPHKITHTLFCFLTTQSLLGLRAIGTKHRVELKWTIFV